MLSIGTLVGLFGVAMAVVGSCIAIFVGLVGLSTGGEGAGIQLGRGVIGVLIAGVALVVSITAARNPILGAFLLAGLAIFGVIVTGAYYSVGAILLLIASLITFMERRAQSK